MNRITLKYATQLLSKAHEVASNSDGDEASQNHVLDLIEMAQNIIADYAEQSEIQQEHMINIR